MRSLPYRHDLQCRACNLDPGLTSQRVCCLGWASKNWHCPQKNCHWLNWKSAPWPWFNSGRLTHLHPPQPASSTSPHRDLATSHRLRHGGHGCSPWIRHRCGNVNRVVLPVGCWHQHQGWMRWGSTGQTKRICDNWFAIRYENDDRLIPEKNHCFVTAMLNFDPL